MSRLAKVAMRRSDSLDSVILLGLIFRKETSSEEGSIVVEVLTVIIQ